MKDEELQNCTRLLPWSSKKRLQRKNCFRSLALLIQPFLGENRSPASAYIDQEMIQIQNSYKFAPNSQIHEKNHTRIDIHRYWQMIFIGVSLWFDFFQEDVGLPRDRNNQVRQVHLRRSIEEEKKEITRKAAMSEVPSDSVRFHMLPLLQEWKPWASSEHPSCCEHSITTITLFIWLFSAINPSNEIPRDSDDLQILYLLTVMRDVISTNLLASRLCVCIPHLTTPHTVDPGKTRRTFNRHVFLSVTFDMRASFRHFAVVDHFCLARTLFHDVDS